MKTLLLFATVLMFNTFKLEKVKVFICTDPKSQIYHYVEDCKNLEKCTFEIKKTDKAEAEDQDKRECKLCKDKNPKLDKKKE